MCVRKEESQKQYLEAYLSGNETANLTVDVFGEVVHTWAGLQSGAGVCIGSQGWVPPSPLLPGKYMFGLKV